MAEGANGLGKAMRVFINDADMLGTSLANYARNVAREVIGVGRAGTLIDWEPEGENRVYASLYTAENILNWRVERIRGRNVLTLLVLHETIRQTGVNAKDADEFDVKFGEQIRVLKRADDWCPVEVWRPMQLLFSNCTTVWRISPHPPAMNSLLASMNVACPNASAAHAHES